MKVSDELTPSTNQSTNPSQPSTHEPTHQLSPPTNSHVCVEANSHGRCYEEIRSCTMHLRQPSIPLLTCVWLFDQFRVAQLLIECDQALI